MVDSIDQAKVREFSRMVHVAAQQMKSRMRPFVKIKSVSGEDFAYDGLEQVEAHEIVGRNTPTQFSDITHNRRQILPRRIAVALPIDRKDAMDVLIDPKNEYVQAVIRSLERYIDRIVLDAMFADAKTGKNFGTTTTFAADGGLTVNAQAGLTYEKLLEIHQNFIDNEVGNDAMEDFVLGISGDEHTQLMQEIELTSGDFVRDFSVEKGEIKKAAGFNIVKFGAAVNNPMLNVTSAVRDCFAMSTRGMVLGIKEDIKVRIDERKDLNYTTQVFAEITMGAVRSEGLLVQKVQTTE